VRYSDQTIDRAIRLYLEGGYVEDSLNLCRPPITTYTFYKELEKRGYDKRGRVSRREVVDPEHPLKCSNCGKEKPAKDFSMSDKTKCGYDTSCCKLCKRSKVNWQNVSIERRIYHRTKGRAKRKGIPFNIDLEDIELPEKCPVFDKPFIYGDHSWTYSIDRIEPDKGYVKGNIQIISNKANMMKSNASFEEVEALYEWMKLTSK